MMLETTVLLDGLAFPEGPRWRDGKLWFSDIDADRVLTVDMEGNAGTVVDVPGGPSGLGWLPDGRLQIVSVDGRCLLRLDPDGLTKVADLSELASSRTNDMIIDQLGRAYIGNFGYSFLDSKAVQRLANIVMVMPDGRARIVAEDLAFPNGMVITPDGQTLIVAESLAARLTAFDIAADGSLARRRIWAQFDDKGFMPFDTSREFPDGICLDEEGAIWVASAEGSREVLRVLEGGKITHRVKVDTQPFAAMLGGPDRQTLFVCTSWLSGEPPGSGRIETVKVEVPGAGLP